jgi:hypothetical protein
MIAASGSISAVPGGTTISGQPSRDVDLAAVAARAVEITDERELAQLRHAADEAIEEAARSADFRERAVAFRAVGQMRYRAKTELLRRGLEDDSPACRGSALLSLELLSRDQPGVVNGVRSLLHSLANADPNAAVRRLAVLALKNGSPHADTLVLLEHLAESDEEERELRAAAAKVVEALKKKSRSRQR